MCLTSEAFDALSNAGKREYLDRVVAVKDAEIAKLREERAIHLASIAEHSQQLAAARAALDGEREACDAARRCVVVHDGRETGTDATACARWRQAHDQRRAAESKTGITAP